MKVRNVIALLTLLAVQFMSTVAAQVPTERGPQTFALVVGISQYQNSSIPRLTYADKDASLFAEWLQSKSGGSVPAYQLTLLTNEAASLANIYAALDWLKSRAGADDKVFIYFSGHGDVETDDTSSKGYLLAWNSPPTNYRNNAIGVADLNENANTLATINKAKVIIITDACHSGKMAGDFYKGRALTAENLRLVLNNQVRLASCEAGEEAAEGPGWGGGRGVFSYHLLRGLQGLASPQRNATVSVKSLDTFLKTSFSKDPGLALEKHIQHPVIDGNPFFQLATVDGPTLDALESTTSGATRPISAMPAGLQSLKPFGRQPIDFFFSIVQTAELDTILDFRKYRTVAVAEVPIKMVGDLAQWLRTQRSMYDSLRMEEQAISRRIDSIFVHKNKADSLSRASAVKATAAWRKDHENIADLLVALDAKTGNKDLAVLETLLTQLQNNDHLVNRFNEKFVSFTHAKTQDMINAYLQGDLAELEKRQYYYSGSRQYREFLDVLDVAIHVTPEQDYLHRILLTNRAYLTGLVYRIEIATASNPAMLLQEAFSQQRLALQLEPYAAHIYNEIGNLYLHRGMLDSAFYHFDFAILLSPAWAVPWSNKIRLNLAAGDIPKAKEAIRMAQSLQPNLAYVNVNAGLVMEKDSNWLAAESYYLTAIAQNNVHYLPFERLGLLYISIGKYRLSDSFLLEAKIRKERFAINDFSFRFGIELGGAPEGRMENKNRPECNLAEDAKVTGWKPMIELAKALIELEKVDSENTMAKKLIQSDKTGLAAPLLHHYLGRKYFKERNWTKAAAYLEAAVTTYASPLALQELLKTRLRSALGLHPAAVVNTQHPGLNIDDKQAANSARVDTSCLLNMITYYSYDELEDQYLLANVYEKQRRFDDALNIYSKTREEENQRLLAQAHFKGYIETSMASEEGIMKFDTQLARYETPVRMGATLKAARLLERLNNFNGAEKVLLNQVKLNREAGFARQTEMNNNNFGPAGKNPFNHFWLKANYDLEAETYNFYRRMLDLFPREAEWYRKAGMFLYYRLLLTYTSIPVTEQKAFYEFSKYYAYPYKGDVSGPTEGIDEEGKVFSETNRFFLPGTQEEVEISMNAYDPLLTALTWLKLAERFSGQVSIDPVLKEATADLNKWMGNIYDAVADYSSALGAQRDNHRVRNNLLEILEAYKDFPAASVELDRIRTLDTLSNEQIIKLAYYKIMSNQSGEGLQLLDGHKAADSKERNLAIALRIQLLILKGQSGAALALFKNIMPEEENQPQENHDEPVGHIVQFDNIFYTEARLHALLKDPKIAFGRVKALLASGFPYQQVLLRDPAFASLRKRKKWSKLLKRYPLQELAVENMQSRDRINYNAIKYRIPGSAL